MSDKMYQPIMQQGPQIGQIFTLLTTAAVIGRDPMADIVISDPEVSRQHARLTHSEDGYRIQDLGSTNGTFVNGQRLAGEPFLLHAGQEILLGSSIILLYLESAGEGVDLLDVPSKKTAVPDAIPAMPAFTTTADDFEDDDEMEAAVAFPTIEESLAAQRPVEAFKPIVGDLPSFTEEADEEPPAAPPPPRAKPEAPNHTTPLVADGPSTRDEKRKRTVTWVIVTILLIICCCCAFVLSAWYIWGDPLMHSLGFY